MEKKLVFDIGDKPKFGQMLVFALQQVLAILAATIAVPTIIGIPTEIPAAILGAGIGTLVYQLFTKFKSPVFLGSSFAFLGSLSVALAYGYCGIILGSVVAGLVYVVIAIIIHFVGTNWVDKLIPPVVIGPTVALIGLSLAGSAMGDIVKANASVMYGANNLVSLLCGLVAFFVIVICSTQKKYKMARLIPFIIGIAAGYAVAAVFTLIGSLTGADYLMIINFQPVIDNFVAADGTFKGLSAFIDYPHFALRSLMLIPMQLFSHLAVRLRSSSHSFLLHWLFLLSILQTIRTFLPSSTVISSRTPALRELFSVTVLVLSQVQYSVSAPTQHTANPLVA